MPRGTRHTLTGILRRTRLGYALEMDGGGIWHLDIGWGWGARRNINRRVTVEGIRSGFDLLDVYRLRVVGDRDLKMLSHGLGRMRNGWFRGIRGDSCRSHIVGT